MDAVLHVLDCELNLAFHLRLFIARERHTPSSLVVSKKASQPSRKQRKQITLSSVIIFYKMRIFLIPKK